MDNQPSPPDDSLAACSRCKFARIVPNTQNPLEKVLVCYFLPPTPMLAMTQHGPVLLPSTHAPVMGDAWCFQFQRAENLAEISSTSAPKLLGSEGKSILNS
jgi:hypothetical protein